MTVTDYHRIYIAGIFLNIFVPITTPPIFITSTGSCNQIRLKKCGLYVVNFIHYVSYYKLDKFISYYNIKFTSRNLRQNDALVTSYYFKHLSNARTCTFWKPSGKFKRAITYAECVKYKR